jgi:hypothetical protein
MFFTCFLNFSFVYSFELAILYITAVLLVHAYVGLQSDCIIVAFYSQTRVQLRLLRDNLERLADSDDGTQRSLNKRQHNVTVNETSVPYVDNNNVQMKLVQCVKHHKLIVWWVL